ncbi:site-2 protease family protein [Thiomicrorhabdus sediminis]|uniref:Site-2 protease family protein n=1 Tax=Thiomicrorhabdus sediminis TaxID=2580412 RepID=A0A4P9K6Q6_9GAMM|nr:site-2 protease family protein [Thiomicrorhabdus sediminis]QCU90140.1 site-2 protease family protein [Thiomicrorhabdus sediminis]
MNELSTIQLVAVWALPVIFAITLHEVAHGWAALKFGDKTALMLGRLTLNPLKHIDPIGTVIVPLVLVVLGGFVFGWAKAVPVDTRNFRNPAANMAWVALAGPAANLLMAIGWALLTKLGTVMYETSPDMAQFVIYSGIAGVSINLILMVLNLIPIPPLDGSRVLSAFLPKPLAWQYNRLEPYGFFILLGLLFFGILTPLLLGPFNYLKALLFALVGL